MTIESSLVYTKQDGTQGFVHDSFGEFFLAKWFVNMLTSGKMSLEEARRELSLCESLNQTASEKAYSSFGESHKFRLFSSGEDLFRLHYTIAEMLGDSFILDINELELKILNGYLGKELEFRYFERGDDDEGYAWEKESKTSMVFDGIICKGNKFYFVGHNGKWDYALSPGSKEVAEYVDGSILTGIYYQGQRVLADARFRAADYIQRSHIWSMHCRESFDQSNLFITPDYLKKNGMILLFGTTDK